MCCLHSHLAHVQQDCAGECMRRLVLDVLYQLVLDVLYWLGRNLSHPVAQQLESLVEQFNPDYNRKNKQRTKEVWGPKLMKSKPANAESTLFWQYLDLQCAMPSAQRQGHVCSQFCIACRSARLSMLYCLHQHSDVALPYGLTWRSVKSWHVAVCRWPL